MDEIIALAAHVVAAEMNWLNPEVRTTDPTFSQRRASAEGLADSSSSGTGASPLRYSR